MTTTIPPVEYKAANSASTTLGTAELKRHIALMFGDPITPEMTESPR
ncbi:hypothetical protein [Rhodococcus globerulus]|nr:hypothetical protein [Rhodococcus globerulus]MCE4267698.1 hypothetical protein [Rhodococcus globerulus]